MGSIGIVTDSHSSITQKTASELGIFVLPMPFYIGEECFYEDITLSREEFFKLLDSGADISTSQPSPAAVMALWDKALKEYTQILYMPISSGLSGSCASAMAMAREEPYNGRVFVVDNGRVSTPLHRSVLDALELIKEDWSAPQIKKILEDARSQMCIYIGVQTLEHLKKGGRITPSAAAVANLLNIKPVLRLSTGKLDTFKKCRGFCKAKKTMIEALQHDLDSVFRESAKLNEITILAAGSASAAENAAWAEEVREAFPGMDVMYDDLSLGVSCHIGYGGLGIGCSCRPERPAGPSA